MMALVVLSAGTKGAPPVLQSLSPRGLERGKPVEILVSGTNMTPTTRLVFPFAVEQKVLPEAKPNPALARIEVVVPPATPLGMVPVRVLTDEGISGPLLVGVDAFPSVREVEDNNAFERAQKVVPPVIVDGQCPGGDVDFYRFTARKGQRLVLEVESARIGAAFLPFLRLTDDKKRLLASDDTQALNGDARLVFVAPMDGDYVVELSDTRYRGGNPAHYRLKIADYDFAEEVFPLGGKRGSTVDFTFRGGNLAGEVRQSRALADSNLRNLMHLSLEGLLRPGMMPPRVAIGDLPERLWLKNTGKDPRALDVQPPLVINSRLEKPGDVDRFQFSVEAGQIYRLAVGAEPFGSRLDGVLRVTDQMGRQLALADDTNILPTVPGLPAIQSADPELTLTVPAGSTLLVVELKDQRGRGGINFCYRMSIAPAVPDYLLQLAVSEINVPRGGTALLPVSVIRTGFLGPIDLALRDLPTGWTARGGRVAGLGTSGLFSISAPADGNGAERAVLVVEGRGVEGGREIRHQAEVNVILNRELAGPGAILPLSGVAIASTGADPFALEGPAALEIVQGYPATVPVKVARGKDQAMLAIQVSAFDPLVPPAAPPPGGLVFQAAAAANGPMATTTVTAGPNVPAGPLDLAIQGKAKVAGVDRTVVAPIVQATVRRPFEIVLEGPTLALVPGTTITLKGQVRRQPAFKDAVTLTLAGLPAGVILVAAPAPVAANQNDFAIALKVDPKAAVNGTLTLTASTTIGGVAYPQPVVNIAAMVKK